MLLCQIFWHTRSHLLSNLHKLLDDSSIFISYLEISSMYVCHYDTYKEEVKSRHFNALPLTYFNPINNRKMIMTDQTMPIWMFFQQKVYF